MHSRGLSCTERKLRHLCPIIRLFLFLLIFLLTSLHLHLTALDHQPKVHPTISSVSACDNTRIHLALLMLHHAAPRRRLPRGRPTDTLHTHTVVRSLSIDRAKHNTVDLARSTTSCAGGNTPKSRKLKAVRLIQIMSVMAGALLIMPGSSTACALQPLLMTAAAATPAHDQRVHNQRNAHVTRRGSAGTATTP